MFQTRKLLGAYSDKLLRSRQRVIVPAPFYIASLSPFARVDSLSRRSECHRRNVDLIRSSTGNVFECDRKTTVTRVEPTSSTVFVFANIGDGLPWNVRGSRASVVAPRISHPSSYSSSLPLFFPTTSSLSRSMALLCCSLNDRVQPTLRGSLVRTRVP